MAGEDLGEVACGVGALGGSLDLVAVLGGGFEVGELLLLVAVGRPRLKLGQELCAGGNRIGFRRVEVAARELVTPQPLSVEPTLVQRHSHRPIIALLGVDKTTERALVAVRRGALKLGGVGLHLGQLEHRPKRAMSQHHGVAARLVEQALKHSMRTRGSHQRDIRPRRSAQVADDACSNFEAHGSPYSAILPIAVHGDQGASCEASTHPPPWSPVAGLVGVALCRAFAEGVSGSPAARTISQTA